MSKKIISLLKRRILQDEDHTTILIDFASVWPRLSFLEDKTILVLKNSIEFRTPSHLVIGLWWPFKNLLNSCDFWELYFKISLLVIDYTISFWRVMTLHTRNLKSSCLVIDYTTVAIDYRRLKFKFKFLKVVKNSFNFW